MFYNVAKATKDREKEKYADDRKGRRHNRQRLIESEANMDPGLWGRNLHNRSRSKSPRPPDSRGASRSRSRARNGSFVDEGDETGRDDQEHIEDYDSTEEYGEGDYGESDEDDDFMSVPKCMLGQPLKDADSGQDNTFVVVANKLGKQVVFRFCKEKSLFLFGTQNVLRRINIYIFTHQYFEIGILLTIVTNCVFMALQNPPEISEYIFAAIYTMEMIVKILAKGFILHKYSYLRNAWNWLDFIVVILGYVTMHPAVSDLSGIRTFRVLRALKTISTVKGLKAMVNTLLKSMKMMTDVLILTLFFISIFALIGLQLFPGKLRSRCVRNHANYSVFHESYYSKPGNILLHEGQEVICGNASTAWNCPSGYTCTPGIGENPNQGYVNYDNFLSALLTSLQVCTLDYWESVYNSVLAAMGEIYMIYFLLAVFLGPFYLLNLVLAVVSASYEMEVNGCPDEDFEREKAANIRRSASTYSFDGDNCVEFLHGPSPVEEINDGEKRYTVQEESPKKKKKPKTPDDDKFMPPEPGENPTCRAKMQYFFFRIVSSSPFEGFIIACIMLNTILMAIEHYGMSKTLEKILEIMNYVFTGTFILEMCVKLLAFTPRGYVRNKWNVFDGFLVMVSIVDILLSRTGAVKGNQLSVLKVFRLMRVLKLAQSWKTMGQLLSTIASSMGALGNVTVILGLIIYIFSVVGMQLFGKYYKPTDYAPIKAGAKLFPRYNFSNFGNSFMMIFRILCGKWIEPQWDLLAKTNIGSIFFIFFVFVIGRWVVLNLFLALLLSSFGGDALNGGNDGDSEKPKQSRLKRLMEWVKKKNKKKNKDNTIVASNAADDVPPPEIMHVEYNGDTLILDGNGNKRKMSEVDQNGSDIKSSYRTEPSIQNGITPNGDILKRRSSVDTEIPISVTTEAFAPGKTQIGRNSSSSVEIEIQREKTYVDDCLCTICYKCSCCYTSYLNSPLRRSWHNARFYTKQLIEHKYFEGIILFLIAFSSLTLVFEDIDLPNRPNLEAFLYYCNYFFAVVFTLEFLIKLFALGFVKYFTNFWNLLDVFIVVISLSSLFGPKNLKALRSLRGLRPLRAISRFEGMKVVVNALLYSIPSIANVLLVCVVFWLIFSIMGYNLFGGQFWYCIDANGNKLNLSVIDTKADCLNETNQALNYTWINKNINFDTSINGFLALFQTATLEGWFEAMADAQDIRGVEKQPGYQEAFESQIFFVVFIILGAFFILNLFIGVIIDNFNRLKQQYEDGVGIFLTPGQRNWINTLKAASLKKPSRRLTRPKAKWRAALFDFIHTKYFEFFIMSVILLNMLTMMIQHDRQSDEVTLALEYLNYLFTGIFTIEAVVRLTAMRLEYFKYGMNVFDFVIVVFSIAVIIMDWYEQDFIISPGLFRVVRVFRLGRLLRFFEGAKGIRKLLFTIVKSAPALSNIGTLLFLITFIYAIMAMSIFGRLKHQGYINQVVNFETFGSSMCLLFRISTAAGWNGVLDSAMVQPPKCDPNLDIGATVTSGNCGHELIAVLFFVSYIILIVLIIINMYIAVILENFNQAQSQDEAGITEDDLEAFYVAWEEFDPKATQFIKYSQLPDFIDALDGPLRVPKPNYWFLEEGDISIKERHRCHCLDIMTALIKRALGDAAGGESKDLESVLKKVEEKYRTIFPQRTKEIAIETTRERLKTENSAARRIQRVFRRHLLMDEIALIANSRNMSLRAREKNLSKIEQLVTVMWKTQRNNPDADSESESEDEEGGESEGEHEKGESNTEPPQQVAETSEA
ncbi:sodium channel protein 60E-like isoform X2 [Hydractinia symbiolongicarpus]|uniref:sodium channel protein 60E-like isoform X2 n=1 Tax=Hydractinia symbiolongicarpus TaxID=13093 RepID=UPI00254A9795|nr:sodium channel protein 60E-like isoform X2 [Hydractinia symbiolongicarpus]